MRANSALCLLVLTAGLLLPAVERPERGGEKEAEVSPEEKAARVLDQDKAEGLTYPSYDERRDVFYSIQAVLSAEHRLAQLEAADREGDPGLVGPSSIGVNTITDTEDVRQAEVYANQAVSEVEAFIRSEGWERAMTAAERHLNRLGPMRERFADNKTLSQAQTMLQQYYVLAENKKLYEEARAQFEALGLRVEGIIWSAEQPSLTIISGEPVARGVNDRVKGTVIKNIDQNRVDFMYAYRQRRFHFQLYLEPKN